MLVAQRRPAMKSWFECRLVGDDPKHLGVVAAAILDEVDRVARLLSRHDPAGEVARVNREAPHRPVRVDGELVAVLTDALAQRDATDGFFDVVIPRGSPADLVQLDPAARTVRFLRPDLALDLGGYGKGYALDTAARLLPGWGVTHALLHGGTSSVRTFGRSEAGSAWAVGLVDPADGITVVGRVALPDGAGLSTSGIFDPGSVSTDLIDPVAGTSPTEPASCVVVATSATVAEVYSTALLVMGKDRATRYLRARGDRVPGVDRVAWIDRAGLDWLVGEVGS